MYLEEKLKAAITEDMTLDEILDAFREVCQIPVEVEDDDDDILLFETGVYDFTGEDLFYFSIDVYKRQGVPLAAILPSSTTMQ